MSKTATCEDLYVGVTNCLKAGLASGNFVQPRMKRGPNWKYGDQDGNGEGFTFVTGRLKNSEASDLMVTWETEGKGSHRYIMKNDDCQVRPVIGQGKICLKKSSGSMLDALSGMGR